MQYVQYKTLPVYCRPYKVLQQVGSSWLIQSEVSQPRWVAESEVYAVEAPVKPKKRRFKARAAHIPDAGARPREADASGSLSRTAPL